ncbi:hypothetical protein KUTeg_000114 [Tegillarca granosa]|uniref:TIR domain-containing protein n=1 Tax=Tegillarca granosa TaxID=220873 RepID=A0ABQ9G102_TEGGR|nr:hypothetical protein KUTeg_000114 [Tegillarca granosa]
MSIIHNVSMYQNNVAKVRGHGFVKVLTPYLESPSNNARLIAIAAMADIVNEEESELLQKGQNVLEFLKKVLRTAMKEENRMHPWLGWPVWELIRKAIGTLRTLSFDEEIQAQMISDTNSGIIEIFIEERDSTDDKISKSSKVKQFAAHQAKEQERAEAHKSKGHVMISYQWSNQHILLKVCQYLRNNNFKVWMDVDDMAGSTLEAMARAVEEAEVVLVCYSRKYKDSDNCRAEAEYAFEKRKPIVPLRMENGYKADGWLGIIIGAKKFYDFSGKYTFDSRTEDLVKELRGKFSFDQEQIVPPHALEVYSQACTVIKSTNRLHTGYRIKMESTLSISTPKEASVQHVNTPKLPSVCLKTPEKETEKDNTQTHEKNMKVLKRTIEQLKTYKRKTNNKYTKKYCEVLKTITEIYHKTDLQLYAEWFQISRELASSGAIIILCDLVVDIYAAGLKNEDNFVVLGSALSILTNSSDVDQESTPIICDHPKFLKIECSLIDSFLTVIHNVAMYKNNVSKVRSHGFVKVLTPYLESPIRNARLLALAALADIVDEEESEILQKGQNIFEFLKTILSMAMRETTRTDPLLSWEVWELIRIMRTIARNDTNKKALMNFGFLPLLAEVGKSEDLREKREAIRTLRILSFEKEIQAQMISDTSSGVCQYLRGNNFKVWMDVDDLVGSTLEAMARAVEQAEVVLVCYSRKYKDSENCRAEAEYAFEKRKQIVPLRMEQAYKADGWLGIIIGAKKYYDFSGKYHFNSIIEDLVKELRGRFRLDQEHAIPQGSLEVYSQPDRFSSAAVSTDVKLWSSAQVCQWLDKHKLDSRFTLTVIFFGCTPFKHKKQKSELEQVNKHILPVVNNFDILKCSCLFSDIHIVNLIHFLKNVNTNVEDNIGHIAIDNHYK